MNRKISTSINYSRRPQPRSTALQQAGRQCGGIDVRVATRTRYRRNAKVTATVGARAKRGSRPGGVVSSSSSGVSERTVGLLEEMMKKANLSAHQIKAMKAQLTTTGTLPLDAKRDGDYAPRPPPVSRKERMQQPIKKWYVRRKSKGRIERERESSRHYYSAQPSRGKDMSKEKERFVRVLETGKKDGGKKSAKKSRNGKEVSRISVSDGREPTMQEVLEAEIEERLVFLADMAELGRGEQYKSQIMLEVQQREKQIKRLMAS
mmetsp:Transcript_30048/g.52758  ORF Transcript_30048/g.52758 Transcript_30048/m.52758 type:complete len:263 (-) Transcript_30048:202-990(-)